jgi:hypothetical protein
VGKLPQGTVVAQVTQLFPNADYGGSKTKVSDSGTYAVVTFESVDGVKKALAAAQAQTFQLGGVDLLVKPDGGGGGNKGGGGGGSGKRRGGRSNQGGRGNRGGNGNGAARF